MSNLRTSERNRNHHTGADAVDREDKRKPRAATTYLVHIKGKLFKSLAAYKKPNGNAFNGSEMRVGVWIIEHINSAQFKESNGLVLYSFPTFADMKSKLGLDDDTLSAALRALEEARLFVRYRQNNGDHRHRFFLLEHSFYDPAEAQRDRFAWAAFNKVKPLSDEVIAALHKVNRALSDDEIRYSVCKLLKINANPTMMQMAAWVAIERKPKKRRGAAPRAQHMTRDEIAAALAEGRAEIDAMWQEAAGDEAA